MHIVRVLQGCSIEVGGIWYHQGAVLPVDDPSAYTRTLEISGKKTVLPCVELTDAAVNIPEGLVPTETATPDEPEKE